MGWGGLTTGAGLQPQLNYVSGLEIRDDAVMDVFENRDIDRVRKDFFFF